MTFRSGRLLWLLAAIPFALLFLIARERLRTALARRFTSERLRGAASASRRLRPWLLGAALTAAVIALAGPYAGFTLIPITTRESNRVIAIDVSNSMGAEDTGTSRLAAAKVIARRLADAQPGRVALIVFEAGAEVAAPFTTDTEAIGALVDTLLPGELGQPGSDLGSAVIAALQLVEADPAQKADVVVISDGEDQGSRVSEATQRAKARGIQVSTVLLGTADGGTIPTARGPLRDSSGTVVTTYAHPEGMKELASGTGGVALANPFAERALDPLLGRSPAAGPVQTEARVPIDRYQWPLGFAFVALLAGSLLHRGAE